MNLYISWRIIFTEALNICSTPVLFETVMGEEVEVQPVALPEAAPKSVLKHLLVSVSQEGSGTATVYLGCRRAGSVPLPMTPKQMMTENSTPKLVGAGVEYH